MPCKETRKSHTCFAKNNTKARWLKICQTMLEEPISVHIKSTWTYRHPRKSWRSDQGIVCHVNLLFKITKEKGVFYIHLTKRSTLLSSNRNNSPNCNHLSDQSKSLLIVHLISYLIPRATNHALYQSKVPSEWSLIEQTHLQPITLTINGQGTS
jgi:hypothetical protein